MRRRVKWGWDEGAQRNEKSKHLQTVDNAQWLGASQVVAGERLTEKAEERPLQTTLRTRPVQRAVQRMHT